MNPIIDTWQISHRMNELLLGSIPDEQLADVAASKGRSVGAVWAHMHNVRLMWLQVAAPDLHAGQQKLEKEGLSQAFLKDKLRQSAAGISTLLERGLVSGRIKGFKPHPEAFLGYMIAHEAHHRAQVIMILKENKHLPDKKVLYGLWEWGSH